jgi:hypothetical protein
LLAAEREQLAGQVGGVARGVDDALGGAGR